MKQLIAIILSVTLWMAGALPVQACDMEMDMSVAPSTMAHDHHMMTAEMPHGDHAATTKQADQGDCHGCFDAGTEALSCNCDQEVAAFTFENSAAAALATSKGALQSLDKTEDPPPKHHLSETADRKLYLTTGRLRL